MPLAPERRRRGKELRERISKIKVLHNLHVFVGATARQCKLAPEASLLQLAWIRLGRAARRLGYATPIIKKAT